LNLKKERKTTESKQICFEKVRRIRKGKGKKELIETYCTIPFKDALKMELMLAISHLPSKRQHNLGHKTST
jgi:hypothetical protein